MQRYNNFHKHTHYSNIRTLDCVSKPIDYINRALELGHTTYFTTEHGYQGNVFEAHTLCQQHGLKCIYGVEAYYVDDMHDKSSRTSYHIMLVAMTARAIKEINRIMSIANDEGFYYKPRIDRNSLLSLTPTDTVITTACVASRMFKGDDWEEEFFLPLHEHFGENFYLEVQNHNEGIQIEYNKKILEVSKKHGVGLIHANDSHYILPEDARYRDLFLRAKGIVYEDESNFILDYPDYDTVVERYRKQGVLNDEQIEEALRNTLVFDNSEGVVIDKEFKIPKVTEGNSDAVLRGIIRDAWAEEKKHIPKDRIKEYEQAIYYEMDIIKNCGMADYFILDHKIIEKAVNEYDAVLTRSGRGSAVSFYINRLLGLTEIDRLKSPITLYPTRFMSAERILDSRSLPDIDLNFADVEPVVKASKDILGEEGIYYMVAYKPLQESSAFRLWCKANGYHIDEYNEIAKDLENHVEDRKWKQVIEDSKVFRGVIESIAPSPCSFLLLDKPIPEEVGLIRVGNSTNHVMCCALDGYNCDVYKYLKNDYLTVKVYQIIKEVYELIGRPIDDIGTLIRNCDDKVWDVYANALTTTINQADSDIGKQLLKRYKPKSLAELSAWVAAIRPGFASLLNTFINREAYTTGVAELDKVLDDSFHFMIYQESIMKYLVWLGMEEKGTYDIIKKIAKKKFSQEELDELQVRLKGGWIDNVGTEDGFAETWQVVQDAAHYSFNACVSGDTVIQRSGLKKSSFKPTVEEMYLIMNDISYAKSTGHLALHNKYVSFGYGNALSMFDDGRIRKNKIVDIRFSGVRDIYRVRVKSGAFLDCTMNHKFPTPNGKITLANLSVGDLLYVKGEYEKHPDDYRFTDGNFVSNLPVKGQRGFQCVPDGNSVRFNALAEYKKSHKCSCEKCGKEYDGSKFELHHKDLDRTNNDESNLEWLCNSCHKKEHYKVGRNKVYDKGIPTYLDEICSIEYLRTDKTYDIEMEHPAHTFVSESGLVTSNSHSLSVGIDSLYGAYLKAHYPLEYYTVVLTLYADDLDRTSKLIAEMPHFGIVLEPIKFGKSGSDYTMDKENNVIYKGIASIKYCNEKIADELLEIADDEYDSFIDLLDAIHERTSINSRQLSILTGLDFFSDFGNNKYLMSVMEIYDTFSSKKIIAKNKMEELGVTEFLMKKYSGKETKSQYRELDNNGLMREMCGLLKNEKMNVVEQMKFELEYLGYVNYVNPNMADHYYAVVSFKTFSDPCKPLVTIRRICDGTEIVTRVKQAKVFKENAFGLLSILRIDELCYEFKKKKIGDSWQVTDEEEVVLREYEVIKG